MEILVHTISHSDLVVELSCFLEDNVVKKTKARPKFSCFQPISHQIRMQIEKMSSKSPLGKVHASVAHAHEREMDDPHYAFKAHCSETEFPVGFRLTSEPILVSSLSHFRIKNCEDGTWLQNSCNISETPVYITAVYFPLLAVLLPKWKNTLTQHQCTDSTKLLYLISGAGIPRDADHSIQGNSTEETSALLIHFCRQYYDFMTVESVHSGSDIFRYDENVSFVNQKLKPLLEAKRQDIVNKRGEGWKNHFHVTIAYGGGAPARLSAVNASLRLYRPSFLHLWQLKTFWHESKLSLEDVDFHSFENIEASPAIPLSCITDSNIKSLVNEMKRYRDQVTNAFLSQHNELSNFWLRKTQKPVLSVLLVENLTEGGESKTLLFRGMNCEVSLPTGSLCAERNVIGTALANDPTLHRSQIKMVAVLSVYLKQAESTSNKKAPASVVRVQKRPRTYSVDESSLPSVVDANPLAPCGACKEWLLKIALANPSFLVVNFANISCDDVYINQLM